MASQMAANANNAGLNLTTAAAATTNGSANNQPSDLSSNSQLNEIQLAQQRFMMMMFLYQQFLQSQTQST
jgi:tetrahydromethanopterin S-methyltransferase subunit E